MNAACKLVKAIEMDGLLWGASKLVPIGYGIKKLQVMCTVEDAKVSVQWKPPIHCYELVPCDVVDTGPMATKAMQREDNEGAAAAGLGEGGRRKIAHRTIFGGGGDDGGDSHDEQDGDDDDDVENEVSSSSAAVAVALLGQYKKKDRKSVV